MILCIIGDLHNLIVHCLIPLGPWSYLGLKNGALSLVDCRICWVGLGGEGEGRTTGVDLGVLASGSCPHSTQIIYILGTLE